MKIIFWILILSIVITAIFFPFDNEAFLSIEWLDYHIEISSMVLVIAFFALFILLTIFTNFLLFLKNIPHKLEEYYKEKQEKKDFTTLLNAFEAIAIDDKSSIKKLYKVIKANQSNLQKKSDLPMALLLAKLCENMSKYDKGYEEEIDYYYQELLHNEKTKFIGLSKLIDRRVTQRRFHDAIFYAEKAYDINPKDAWLLNIMLNIYSELELYDKAEKIIKKATDLDHFSKEKANQLLLTNYIAHSKHAISLSEVEQAISFLEKALKIDIANEEAVFILSRLHSQDNNKKAAQKVLEKAWHKHPSLALAKQMLNINYGLKTSQKVKILENLISEAKENKAGYIALTELYLEEDMIAEARTTMDKLLSLHAADSYMSKLMAIIETKSQNNHSSIMNWLYKI